MQPKDTAFQPIPGLKTARFAGMPTFMRLPHLELDNPQADKTDIAIVGVPFDGGTSNRPGPRHGPRQLRDLSTMIRTTHPRSGVNPFKLVNCADLGDAPVNPMDIMESLDLITGFYNQLSDKGIMPLSAGGDHLVSCPILRALGRNGPVGMIHFDAHTDMNDAYFGDSKYTHGTPFRRAIEQGFLDPKRTIQIGIRGVKYETTDFDWALDQGVRIVEIEELFERGVDDVMQEAREIVGDDETYVSFDIDGIDPAYALTPLGRGVSMGVHESQSRIYENQLGRSRAFCGWLYGQMRDAFGDFGVADEETFYRTVNKLHQGFIRTEADEVQYNLHVLLRFDLERALIAGDLAVDDLEAAWNDRFAFDFGFAVEKPSNGMLQDVHWSVGLFGYFATYSLGNVYAGCLNEAMRADLPNLDEALAQGDPSSATEWLNEALQRHGGLREPRATIAHACSGVEPSEGPLLKYLEEKFGEL